jgi:uncharacterized membrane protein
MAYVLFGTRSLADVLAIAFDRIVIPLAVVVGLAGGAMIGSELARLQAPADTFIH